MTKKVKKMAFGGLNSAPIKTALTLGGPAPVTPTAPLRQAPAPVVPTKTSLGGGKPALNSFTIDPIRTPGGGGRPAPVPVRGGPSYEQHTGGPLVKPNPVPVRGGPGYEQHTGGPMPAPANTVNSNVPRGVRTLGGGGMAKGGKVKSASARADGCAIRGKTRA